jgi:hypothetical protein
MRLTLSLALAGGLLACADSAGPSSGTLLVSTSTTGEEPDQDGYRLTVDDLESLTLEPTGSTELDLSSGRHTLRLLDVAEHCSVAHQTAFEVAIASSATTPVAFEISCPRTGVQVEVQTTGDGIDPDGYRVLVDDYERGGITPNDTLLVLLSGGSRRITLSGLSPTCTFSGPSSQTTTITPGTVIPVQFNVVCSAPPARNVQLQTVSTVGRPPLTLAGGLVLGGDGSLSANFHIQGSNCFDPNSTLELVGTYTGNDMALTSAPAEGQVLTLSGGFLAGGGTYAVQGGCADGDRGNVSGSMPFPLVGRWRIMFEVNNELVGTGLATLTQGLLSDEGSFGVAGSAEVGDFGLACYSGTITAGTFPTASYVMGKSLVLEIRAGDATIVFQGTANETGTEYLGNHRITGGSCDGFAGLACLGREFRVNCHLPLFYRQAEESKASKGG